MVAGHCCGSRPNEVVVKNLLQRRVVCQSDIRKSLVEANNSAAIHFLVLPVAAVHPDDTGLVAIELGICVRTTECLGPVSAKSLHMLSMEAVAKRMADYLI